MRGRDRTSGSLFSYVDLETRVPERHPLRAMRDLVNASLASMDASFEALYKKEGRPSIPPEWLLRASLAQMLHTIRSERQLVRGRPSSISCSGGLSGFEIDDVVFDASTFSQNRDRLLTATIAQEFLAALLALPQVEKLLSAEHFSVDGTLLKAWASVKSFRAKDGSGRAALPGPQW